MKKSNYRITMAERKAEWLWRLYGLTKPEELILEDLAFARNVIVTEGVLDKMEARLLRRGDKGLIRVRKDIFYPGQKRFAIAHELGHWELHKKVSQFFACTSADLVASYKTSPQEGEANIFAAGLLMPSGLFLAHTKKKDFNFETISELTEIFNTSLTSTARRYAYLSNDYCAVVCSESEKIKWWRGSDDFESAFWISPRMQLSVNTVAGGLFKNKSRSVNSEEVDIDAWCDKSSLCESNTFIEESRYFERFNQVITLLRLS